MGNVEIEHGIEIFASQTFMPHVMLRTVMSTGPIRILPMTYSFRPGLAFLTKIEASPMCIT